MMAGTAIVVGPDEYDLAGALAAAGFEVDTVDIGNLPALEEAGIAGTDYYVLTEVDQATSIAVAKDRNESLRVVVYDDGSLPDFARRQADLLLDPALFDPDAVAEEL